jgi:catechol 2,3-dioxygenase-like lactoylglutathione lyase family enzyme
MLFCGEDDMKAAFFWMPALICGSGVSAQTAPVLPWTEAVVSVRDLEGASALFREVGLWRDVARGKISRAELDYYRLPKAARGSYRLICPPAGNRGCIRFVRFDGVAQRPIRLAARPWDTGGIYSIMIRSDNVQLLFDAAIARGWWAESEPIRFDFGGSQLRNVVLTGPHGFNVAVYERVAPPFTAFPVGAMSEGFNSMRMVRDHTAALDFYTRGLGFGLLFNSDYLDDKPTASNFSIPHNYVQKIPRRAAVVQPAPGETGRMELMQFPGFTGKDMSAHASPPNLGIISVRYPVTDISAYRAALKARGIPAVYLAENISLTGVGEISLMAVRDPDGSLTEFYQTAGKWMQKRR